MQYQLSDFKYVRHFIFDIDGVLTDGCLLIHSDGSLLRTMHIKDGYALQLAVKKGFSVSIISGAAGDAIKSRFTSLGISDVHLGITDKKAILADILQNGMSNKDTILYMGDDMPDLQVMKMVYFPCCPADACNEIKAVSRYISPFDGGKGCARDVIEKVLKLNGCWE
jgi:3-deoxy-D-manno-octulosonate 8-phosphate phosphatase (KDO 8-P phosphatase)